MNIYGVRDSLKMVIVGKKQLLETIKEKLEKGDVESVGESKVIVQFLEMNISELENILKDISHCCGRNADKQMDQPEM